MSRGSYGSDTEGCLHEIHMQRVWLEGMDREGALGEVGCIKEPSPLLIQL